MFPTFNPSGVIPPFASGNPAAPGGSPYSTTLTTIVHQLGGTPERRTLIAGLIAYRDALRAAGITTGFQLIDGSFTENSELINERPPGDIDLVTFAHLPVPPPEVPAFAAANAALFNMAETKQIYRCDAYFVDLSKDPRLLLDETFYWYGLFSHQRITHNWKGMLKVPLIADDIAASALLGGVEGRANGP